MRLMVLLVISFFLGISSRPAFACECEGDNATPKKKFYQSRVVFVGKVVDIIRPEDEIYVKFDVARDYKGNLGPDVLITTSAAVCGEEFRVGEEYLIYGYGAGTAEDDVYTADGCASIKKLECAMEEIRILEKVASVRETDLDDAQISLKDRQYFFRTTYDFNSSRCDGCYPNTYILEK